MFASSNIVRSLVLVGSLLPAVRSAVFDVSVGGLGASLLKFDPEFVTAAPGDQVRFIFKQKNHTATQSTFASPCVQAPGGFDSGFIPVAPDVTEGFQVATLDVTDDSPVWVYCRQGNHCQQGMVFAVNPGDRFDAFKAAATGGAAPPPASTTASGTASATASGTPAPSATGTGTDHKVLVGNNNGLTFEPTNVAAQPGDTITFEFRSKNHTVTGSSLNAPCVSLAQTNPAAAWDSGFVPVSPGTTEFPTYQIRVNDTRPIWAYCAQGNHCGQGMVFSVNAEPSGERSFETFQNRAREQNSTAAPSPTTPPTTPDADADGALSSRSSLAGVGTAVIALLVSLAL